MSRDFVIAGGVDESALVPDMDHALLGFVTRGRRPVQPLYDTVAFLPPEVVEDLDSPFSVLMEKSTALAEQLALKYPSARFMLPTPERKTLDTLARLKRLILWDQLYTTIRGTVLVPGESMALVYDFDESVQVLKQAMDGSDWDHEDQVTADVVDFVDRMLVQAWVGETTPFMLFSPPRSGAESLEPPARQDGEALQPSHAEIPDSGTSPTPAESIPDATGPGVSEHGGGDNRGDGEAAAERDPDRGDGSPEP